MHSEAQHEMWVCILKGRPPWPWMGRQIHYYWLSSILVVFWEAPRILTLQSRFLFDQTRKHGKAWQNMATTALLFFPLWNLLI